MKDSLVNQVYKQKTVDNAEIERFSALAGKWWEVDGPFSSLHALNPLRLDFIRRHILKHFALKDDDYRPYRDLTILDLGCGGGLLSEPLARLGARVLGVDADAQAIDVARAHGASQGLKLDYLSTSVEGLEGQGSFDVVCALEIIEHVSDPDAFINHCARLIKPGGLFFASTINKTKLAWWLAIVAGEYLLRWLPQGTHQWDKFVKPQVFGTLLQKAGLEQMDLTGVWFNPLKGTFQMVNDASVNYMLVALKPT